MKKYIFFIIIILFSINAVYSLEINTLNLPEQKELLKLLQEKTKIEKTADTDISFTDIEKEKISKDNLPIMKLPLLSYELKADIILLNLMANKIIYSEYNRQMDNLSEKINQDIEKGLSYLKDILKNDFKDTYELNLFLEKKYIEKSEDIKKGMNFIENKRIEHQKIIDNIKNKIYEMLSDTSLFIVKSPVNYDVTKLSDMVIDKYFYLKPGSEKIDDGLEEKINKILIDNTRIFYTNLENLIFSETKASVDKLTHLNNKIYNYRNIMGLPEDIHPEEAISYITEEKIYLPEVGKQSILNKYNFEIEKDYLKKQKYEFADYYLNCLSAYYDAIKILYLENPEKFYGIDILTKAKREKYKKICLKEMNKLIKQLKMNTEDILRLITRADEKELSLNVKFDIDVFLKDRVRNIQEIGENK